MDEQPAIHAAVRDFLDRENRHYKVFLPEANGRCILAPTKQFLLTRRSPAYWRVTF